MKYDSKTKVTGFRHLCAAHCSVMSSVVAALLLLSAGANRVSAWGITWSDEFTGINNQPWSGNWGFETGGGGRGNNELKIYVISIPNCHIVCNFTGTATNAPPFKAKTFNGQWNEHCYS